MAPTNFSHSEFTARPVLVNDLGDPLCDNTFPNRVGVDLDKSAAAKLGYTEGCTVSHHISPLNPPVTDLILIDGPNGQCRRAQLTLRDLDSPSDLGDASDPKVRQYTLDFDFASGPNSGIGHPADSTEPAGPAEPADPLGQHECEFADDIAVLRADHLGLLSAEVVRDLLLAFDTHQQMHADEPELVTALNKASFHHLMKRVAQRVQHNSTRRARAARIRHWRDHHRGKGMIHDVCSYRSSK